MVRDLEQALAFYGHLGFQTTFHDEGFAIVERDQVSLHLNPNPDLPTGKSSVCWIASTDIDALYQQYLPAEARQAPLQTKPWGFKEFTLRDPSGNLIIFADTSPKRMPVSNKEHDRKAKPAGEATSCLQDARRLTDGEIGDHLVSQLQSQETYLGMRIHESVAPGSSERARRKVCSSEETPFAR